MGFDGAAINDDIGVSDPGVLTPTVFVNDEITISFSADQATLQSLTFGVPEPNSEIA